jgi:L-threonylcarbamoyladenylate synthase
MPFYISIAKKEKKLVETIISGGVVVMPTDTVFGIVASAFNKEAVERLYDVRGRDKDKPCIILCSEYNDLQKFGLELNDFQKSKLKEIWPNPVSVILKCQNKSMEYLHRGVGTLAFRVPKPDKLRAILSKTGPILAPSANPQGLPIAKNLDEAKRYFGSRVDLYVDGVTGDKVSTLISFENEKVTVLREGAWKIKDF